MQRRLPRRQPAGHARRCAVLHRGAP
ncbi:hypothetical protein, partial [Mycobacterium tuberculosis]